jgi:hypothetical protein
LAVIASAAVVTTRHYEVASAAFQIGIVLASARVITGMIVLTWLAMGLGGLGLLFTAIGLLAPSSALVLIGCSRMAFGPSTSRQIRSTKSGRRVVRGCRQAI